MNDTALHEALDRLVPAGPADGDWQDVLQRAGVSRQTAAPPVPVRGRRRLVAAAIAFVAVATAIATPAFGLQRIVLDFIRKDVLFSKAEPAPNVVKKQFADLGFGAPPRFAIGVQAARARAVGTFSLRGKQHMLFVAPTRRGGFCWVFEKANGGCLRGAKERGRRISASWTGRAGPGAASTVSSGEGTLTVPETARLELRYASGPPTTVPFVYVSKPIDAGFFAFAAPKRRRVTALVALDAQGRVLARQDFPVIRRRPARRPLPPPAGPRTIRTLPTEPAVPPGEPLQRGRGGGVEVVAGRNGVVVFRATAVPQQVSRLLRGHGVGYVCFRLTREFGIFDTRGFGVEGRFASKAAVRYFGLGHPLDGCEIQGSYGHSWPDRLGSHSAVEVPFTGAGRRYFADRAAARDLALFVRSRRVQRIRREPGPALERELKAAYPNLRRIRYRLTPTGVTFGETSPTGRRFEVVVSKGRIVRQNLEPYAFVF